MRFFNKKLNYCMFSNCSTRFFSFAISPAVESVLIFRSCPRAKKAAPSTRKMTDSVTMYTLMEKVWAKFSFRLLINVKINTPIRVLAMPTVTAMPPNLFILENIL